MRGIKLGLSCSLQLPNQAMSIDKRSILHVMAAVLVSGRNCAVHDDVANCRHALKYARALMCSADQAIVALPQSTLGIVCILTYLAYGQRNAV